jgi:thioredoxin reductase (NADPH)
VIDQNIAVIGNGARGLEEAEFLRSYRRSISIIASEGSHCLSDEERNQLDSASVAILDGPATDFALTDHGLRLVTVLGPSVSV